MRLSTVPLLLLLLLLLQDLTAATAVTQDADGNGFIDQILVYVEELHDYSDPGDDDHGFIITSNGIQQDVTNASQASAIITITLAESDQLLTNAAPVISTNPAHDPVIVDDDLVPQPITNLQATDEAPPILLTTGEHSPRTGYFHKDDTLTLGIRLQFSDTHACSTG